MDAPLVSRGVWLNPNGFGQASAAQSSVVVGFALPIADSPLRVW
jgi:hypothetical protein